jgi:hypothetical protein
MQRRIVIITLLLILSGGAIVNIAVAWGFASHYNQPPFRASDSIALYVDDNRSWVAAIHDLRGVTLTRTWWWNQNAWARVPMPDYEHVISQSVESAAFMQHEVARFGPELVRFNWGCDFQTVSAGWPARSMWRGIACATHASSISLRLQTSDVHLPLSPIFPGFLINTLFYAALLWLLFLAPFTARRMIRRRRGLCEKCAYPVGTWGGSSVCTECGAAVRPRPND